MDSDRPSSSDHWQSISARRTDILSVRAEMAQRSSRLGRTIDTIGDALANPLFFACLAGAHVLWFVVNAGWIPLVEPWDPYPFMLLATIASVEAPFLALLILMQQQRDRYVDELREEIELQVDLLIEKKLAAVLREILGPDAELAQELDPAKLMASVEREIEEVTDPAPGQKE